MNLASSTMSDPDLSTAQLYDYYASVVGWLVRCGWSNFHHLESLEILKYSHSHFKSAQPKLISQDPNYRWTDSDVQPSSGYLSFQLHVSQEAVANDALTRPAISTS